MLFFILFAVEAEKAKLENNGGGSGFYSSSGSRRYTTAHDTGLVAVTSGDLASQRSSRRAAIMAEEAKLSSMQLGIEATPPPKEAKPSRLDGMRAALGLGKKAGVKKSSGSASSINAPLGPSASAPSADSPGGTPQAGMGWTVEGSGSGSGQSPAVSPYTRNSLRAQYSSGRPQVSPRGSGGGSQDYDQAAPSPSPWGKMFTK